MTNLHYRSDIDGLRAVAIVPVVLFHLGVALFSGGFVGVDVFFVISGFLITTIIHREMTQGQFSFVQFYERRIRRLFPALFAVIAVTAVLALWLLMPADLLAYARSVIAATLFGANLLFWRTSGYFDEPSEMKPLLHTWSLSVEEQFYIVFPVVLLLLVRYAAQHVRAVLAVAAVVSFAAGAAAVKWYPDAAFYLPMFRAWELLLGAMLALNVVPHPVTHLQRHALSLFGLALILYAVFFLSADSNFPGFNAVYPALGAALIIYAGSGGHGSLVGVALSWRPLVLIGLISYSLYLWHWPLIVFTRYYLSRELTLPEQAGLFALALLIAAVSWRYIERPFRGKSGMIARRRLFAVSLAVMAIALAAAGVVVHLKGLPQRMPPEVVRIADVAREADHYRGHCHNAAPEKIDRDEVCQLGKVDGGARDFLLWGDSHALALAPAYNEAGMHKGRGGWVVTKNACAPLLGIERYDSPQRCVAQNDAVLRFIQRHDSIHTVILVGRWGLWANGHRYGGESGRPAIISPLGLEHNREALRSGLERTLQALTQRNIEVIIINDVPEVGWHVPSVLSRAVWQGQALPAGPSREAYLQRQQPMHEIMQGLASQYPFRVVDVALLFCPGDACLVAQDGVPLYRDDDHLSVQGARFVAGFLADSL